MKIVNLLHNQTAGDEAHSKEILIDLLKKHGFECRYFSVKKNWTQMDENVDFIISAGGDGTVRKITKHLLNRKLSDKIWPIALLPLGTANNIATTLGIRGDTDEIIESWNDAVIKKFDVGKIENFEGAEFFMEGYGYGLFPYLIKKMKKVNEEDINHPELALRKALEIFHESIFSYKPKHCNMKIDGVDYSGNFLMVEIMNTRLIGPNLFLSPHGDPGDGKFEVIMVAESDKEKLAAYVADKLNGREEPYQFARVKAEKLSLSWEGTHVHVDDEILKIPKYQEVEIEMRKGLLEFMVPVDSTEKDTSELLETKSGNSDVRA